MARPKSKKYAHPMPPMLRERIQKSGARYYYFDTGGRPRREIPLGKDYSVALMRWAELTSPADSEIPYRITFSWVADQYQALVIPTKAPRTQSDNLKELEKLRQFFSQPTHAPLDEIEPHHVRKYLDWRGKQAKTRANREKALLSHLWNWSRQQGYTKLPNPCAGVKGFRELGRSFYVETELMEAIASCAEPVIAAAIRLAYLTGQRPSDVRKMSFEHVHGDELFVEQNKTGVKRRIALRDPGGALNQLGQLILELKSGRGDSTRSLQHLLLADEQTPLTEAMLKNGFHRAKQRTLDQLVEIKRHDLIPDLQKMQFRDLRAKAGSDVAETDVRRAQLLLGHKKMAMTEHYVRSKRGFRVAPTR